MLFETTGLALRYDPTERLAVCQVVIDEGNLPAITTATAIIGDGEATSNPVSESTFGAASGHGSQHP